MERRSPWRARGAAALVLLVVLALFDHWSLRRELQLTKALAVTAAAHAAANSLDCGRGLRSF